MLGDCSDNEMVGGRKTHFLTRERDILMWLLKTALNSTEKKKKKKKTIPKSSSVWAYLISAHEIWTC